MVKYYLLKKELPNCKINDIVNIFQVSGSKYLSVNDIQFPIEFGEKFSEWFQPVSNEEHLQLCKENTIEYCIKYQQMSLKEATEFANNFI